ncbi:hypothetical protein ETB97_002810 [Aspergillus alliaceus]|uniref:Uncharacterized protein n=1 Tax=Petromyces alliaceus TaxID=209559 RepID=A0A8H6A211_PETAA|nr:hypothetical protein ETB97_002810 [Aspergillus burnettii]
MAAASEAHVFIARLPLLAENTQPVILGTTVSLKSVVRRITEYDDGIHPSNDICRESVPIPQDKGGVQTDWKDSSSFNLVGGSVVLAVMVAMMEEATTGSRPTIHDM